MKKPARKFVEPLQRLLSPILLISAVATPMCWLAAWFFRDRSEFSDALIGLGCLPIVVSICAYLYLLVTRVERN